MQLQMVDLQSEYQHLKQEIDNEIQDVLNSGYFIGGPKVKEFTKQLRSYLQVESVTPCGNGTDALQIALMAIGVQPNDEIILPAFTYVAPAECALLLGCKPVFVDVHPENYNLDLQKLEDAITPNTKAIIPVHLFGQTVNMPKLMQIAKKHKLYVIEDVAQAFGAKLNQQIAGTFGHIGCTSFFPSKNLGCYGDGGAIYTNNIDLGNKCKQIASHGQSGEKFYHDEVGVNSRLDALQAAILTVKLKQIETSLRRRKEIGRTYNEAFQDLDALILPKTTEGMTHTYHQYVLQVNDGRRNALREFLKEKGIASGVYYPYALPDLPPYRSEKVFPVAKKLTTDSLAIPIHPYLRNNQQQYIIENIKAFF